MRDNKATGILQVILGLLSSLSAPAFGYLGARRGSATLMCLFVSLMVVLAGMSVTIMLAVLVNFTAIQWNLRNTVYVLLWVACGAFSAWAALNGNQLFAKLLQGEQIIETTDPEIGLPEIDTRLPVFAPEIGRAHVLHDDDEELKAMPPRRNSTTKE